MSGEGPILFVEDNPDDAVVLTSLDEDRLVACDRRAGSCLRKPADHDRFVSTVRQLEVHGVMSDTPPSRRDP